MQEERQREPRDALLWERRPLGAGGDRVLDSIGDAALRARVAQGAAVVRAAPAADGPPAVALGPLAQHVEARLAATERQRIGYLLRVPYCDAMLEGADADAPAAIEVRMHRPLFGLRESPCGA